MNIIVDRPRLVRAVLQYLNTKFGNLTPKIRKGDSDSIFPGSIFYVDSNNRPFFEFEENGSVWVSYRDIFSVVQKYFCLSRENTELIIKYWLSETYNLKNIVVKTDSLTPLSYWDMKIL
jgi:hypothetical protein